MINILKLFFAKKIWKIEFNKIISFLIKHISKFEKQKKMENILIVAQMPIKITKQTKKRLYFLTKVIAFIRSPWNICMCILNTLKIWYPLKFKIFLITIVIPSKSYLSDLRWNVIFKILIFIIINDMSTVGREFL